MAEMTETNQTANLTEDGRELELKKQSFKTLISMISENTRSSTRGTVQIWSFWVTQAIKIIFTTICVPYYLLLVGGAFMTSGFAVSYFELNVAISIISIGACTLWALYVAAKDLLAIIAVRSERLIEEDQSIETNRP